MRNVKKRNTTIPKPHTPKPKTKTPNARALRPDLNFEIEERSDAAVVEKCGPLAHG
jgi:hypothetical protein